MTYVHDWAFLQVLTSHKMELLRFHSHQVHFQSAPANTFRLSTCLWLKRFSLCSFTTCAPVKQVRLTSTLSVQLMKHGCVYIYDAVKISKGENLNTMKQEVCWNTLAHSSNLLLNQDCVHTNTQEGAHTGGLTESHSKVLLEMRKSWNTVLSSCKFSGLVINT